MAKTEKVEFKKSFKLYGQISIKVLAKFGINFRLFARMKVNEMKLRDPICFKYSFFHKLSKLREYLTKV